MSAKLTKHAATVATLQSAVNGERFTVAEFRDRIAALLRIPGEPVRFRNSANPLLVRKLKKGGAK